VKDRLLLIAFLMILLAFGFLVGRKFLATRTELRPQNVVQQPTEPSRLREVLLYFVAEDGTALQSEVREIEDCQEDRDCVRSTVQALIDGPVGGLAPLIPTHTVVRGLAIEGDLATVDFSSDFISGHPGGSLPELLTVYGLADTLAVNFPYLRQVRILVEGEPVETIKGHIDLRAPVPSDFRYTRGGEEQSRPADSLVNPTPAAPPAPADR